MRIFEDIYSNEEIQEAANEIINNHDLRAITAENNKDGASVCLEDKVSGLWFWFDFWYEDNGYGDLVGDWNQYIFTKGFEDQVRQQVQADDSFFTEALETAEEYAIFKGLI